MSGVMAISADDYYWGIGDSRLPLRFGKPDWNAPASLDWDKLLCDIDLARRGSKVEGPIYDMTTSRRLGHRTIEPPALARAVVVEGIFSFELAHLAPLAKVLLDCPPWIVARRRFRRDVDQGRRRPIGAALYSVARSLDDRRLTRSFRGIADVIIDARLSPQAIASRLEALVPPSA